MTCPSLLTRSALSPMPCVARLALAGQRRRRSRIRESVLGTSPPKCFAASPKGNRRSCPAGGTCDRTKALNVMHLGRSLNDRKTGSVRMPTKRRP